MADHRQGLGSCELGLEGFSSTRYDSVEATEGQFLERQDYRQNGCAGAERDRVYTSSAFTRVPSWC